MLRRGLVAAVALAVLVVPAGADAGGSHRTKCQKLSAKHDLAPAKRVKLVERPNADNGKDLKGCVLPDGKVRTVASSSDQVTTVDRYTLRRVVGHQVLVHTSSQSQYGSGDATYVFDLRTGGQYDVAASCSKDTPGCKPKQNTRSRRARINAKGEAAAVVSVGGGRVQVVGFSSKGQRTVLDSGKKDDIPASSLELHRQEVTWTHAGKQRHATLSG